jgi:hypothetical protein
MTPAMTPEENVPLIAFAEKRIRRPFRLPRFPLIAELSNDRCEAVGIIGRGEAPALELCRRLVAAGADPATPLHAYRGGVLALRIRSIGEGAELTVQTDSRGTPRFQKYRPRSGTAPPVAPIASTLPELPADEITAPMSLGQHGGAPGSAR